MGKTLDTREDTHRKGKKTYGKRGVEDRKRGQGGADWRRGVKTERKSERGAPGGTGEEERRGGG